MNITVWFSCGAASAVAAKKTIDIYGSSHNVEIVNNPILEEDSDNRRFLADVEKWIGQKIQIATNPKYPKGSAEEVWDKRNFMSSPMGAPCTLELKKNARREWERTHRIDQHVLGFTADEKNRHEKFILTERENVIPVLINVNLTKKDCFKILNNAGIDLPRIYLEGYPNANCIGCVKATSPTYWNHVRKKHPAVFKRRADQSETIGAKLVRVKGERILLKDLDPEATGRPMKDMDFECGIFCEEFRQRELFD